MSNEISVMSWFATGWRTYRQRPAALLVAPILLWFIYLPVYLVYRTPSGTILMWGLTTFIFPVCMAGYHFFFLKAVRGEPAQLSDLFAGFRQFGRVWCASLLVQLLMTGGFILLVIPGIVWALKYAFSALLALDQNLTPMESVRFSARMTQGSKWRMVWGILFGLLLSLPSLIVFFRTFRGQQPNWTQLWTPQFVLATLWSILVSPWLSATVVAAYESLRQKAEHQPPVVVTRRAWIPAYIGGLILLWSTISTFREPHATQKLAQQLERNRTERQTRIERKEPILYLPFDGTTSDVGPYGFSIEVMGTPVSFGAGVHNQAGIFNGNSFLHAHIHIDTQKRVLLADGATLELWFKRDSRPDKPGSGTLISTSGGGGNLALTLSDKGELVGRLSSVGFSTKDASVTAHGQSVPIDQWTHAALVYDVQMRTLRLFMNGTLVDEAREGPVLTQWRPISLGVGAWASSTSGSFNGWIDECKIYEFPKAFEAVAESAKRTPLNP